MFPFFENGKVWIPRRAEADDGTIGDAWVELKPGDEGYAETLAWLEREAKERRYSRLKSWSDTK
jgi:hypothetical protein